MGLIVLGCINTNAQRDSNYFSVFKPRLTVSALTTTKHYRIRFESIAHDKFSFENATSSAGLKIRFPRFALSASIPFKSYGPLSGSKQTYFALLLNIYQPKFYVRVGGRYFRGFNKIIANRFEARKDINMIHGIAHGFFVLNSNRFSLRSAFQFTEKQRVSHGSIILAGLIGIHALTADSLVLDTNENSTTFSGYRGQKIGLGTGAAYTWVFGNLLITGLCTAGLEARLVRYVGDGNLRPKLYKHLSPRINFKASICYHRDIHFLALTAYYLPGLDKSQAVNVRIRDFQIRLVLGKRFY